jgi:TPR repeat protein
MSDIFISYASKEPSRAAMLAEILEGHGWSVFWDRTIPVGKTWREIIERELSDARCVIVLWTKASINSDWVHEEAERAKRRRILVPILIEDVEPPLGFGSIQAAHLIDWDGTSSTPMFRGLIGVIAALIGPSPKEAGKAGRLAEAEVVAKAKKKHKRANEGRLLEVEVVDKAEKKRERGDREAEYEKTIIVDDADAMHDLGTQYLTAENYIKAREWYEKAAAKGHADAMIDLGIMYLDDTEAQDYAKAREWFEKAAAKGHAYAMSNLGFLYRRGQGVAQDYVKARKWYEKAVEKGDEACLDHLGTLYYIELKDDIKAREWFEKGAAKGHPLAMGRLGWFYHHGEGVAQDYVKAQKWYEKAAKKGDVQAMVDLGELCHTAWKDYAKAREWFEKAAAKGHAYAMSNLGFLYRHGRGVAQDYVKAREWYEKAAATDYDDTIRARAEAAVKELSIAIRLGQ